MDPPVLIATVLRWRAWECDARKIAGGDERLLRRWVALRHWHETRNRLPIPVSRPA